MVVYSTYWFIYVMKHSTFRWVQFMLFICIVQNLNTCWLVILSYLEATTFHKDHEDAQSIMYAICIFLFYFTSNLMYWMFGFKYWVISIEVPRLIVASKNSSKRNHKSICSEARYEALNWVGILINLGVSLCCGWKRGMVEY